MTRGLSGSWSSWMWLVLVELSAASSLAASSPGVVFDAPEVVAARDVTTHEFAVLFPGEKLVEIVVPVSVWLRQVSPLDVESVVVALHSPERRLRVVDYAPRTELQSDHLGPIVGQTIARDDTSAGLQVRGGWPLAAGVVSGAAQYQTDQQSRRVESYARRAPQTVVVASGTIQQGHGIFVRIQRTPQTALEGEHRLRLIVAVPQAWRGDYLAMETETQFRGAKRSTGRTMSQRVVGVHLEADADARAIVEQLAPAAVALRRDSTSAEAITPWAALGAVLGTAPSARIVGQDGRWQEVLTAVRMLGGAAREVGLR